MANVPGFRRLLCVAIALVLPVAWGCASKHVTVPGPRPGTLQGAVVLHAPHVDGTGAVLDTLVITDAGGITVQLLKNGVPIDSTTTVEGTYRFEGLSAGSYGLRTSVAGMAWTTSASVQVATGTIAPPIDVRPFGDLQVSPNPFSGSVRASFPIASSTSMVMEVRGLNGGLVKTWSGMFAAGFHMIVWDGRDASGADVPPGPLYLVLQNDTEQRLALLDKVPSPPPPGAILGSVVAEGSFADSTGAVVGPMLATDGDDITVVLDGLGTPDTTFTIGGQYRYDGLPPDPYAMRALLATGNSLPVSVTVNGDTVTAAPLQLKSTPGMKAWPNPFGGVVRYSVNVPIHTLVGAHVETLGGVDVRITRFADPFGPGVFGSSWDGTDDLGQPVAAGYYWVVIDVFLGNSARALVRLDRP